MAARLKVFTWSDGLHRYTVATPSRAKALALWGFRRDLFKTGEARQITTGDDYQAALQHPGVSVERGLAVDPGRLALKPPGAAPRPPSKADRARVERLRTQIAALDRERDQVAADLDRRRAALEAETKTADEDFRSRRAGLADQLDAAQRKLGR